MAGNGPEFFQTRMGQTFYEGTMPRIAAALERIATALEKQRAREPLMTEVSGQSVIAERQAKGQCMHGVPLGEVCEACEE